MSKSKKPMFGNLFKKHEDKEHQGLSVVELRDIVVGLSDSTLGLSARIDAEVGKLRKMIQIGSPASEIQQHIAVIANSFQLYLQHVNSQEAELFKRLPAITFIDELISAPLEEKTVIRLKNYRGALSKEVLASNVITDIIDLLGPDTNDLPYSTESNQLTADNIKEIAAPLIKLLNTIELEQGQLKRTSELLVQAHNLSSQEDLCSLIDGISQLIIGSITSATNQFENFLQNLKDRLNRVDNFIEHQDQARQAMTDCSDTLSSSMSQQVDDLQLFMTNSKTMEELESHVKSGIEHILNSLNNFNSRRHQIELDSQAQIKELQEQLSQAQNETENLRHNLQQQRKRALTDPLTKLPNRHAYNDRLHLEYNRWRRYKKPLSLVIADLDHFKKVNDQYGHSVGDQVLSACAHILSSGLRDTDFIGRYGGEEFIILLPETNIKDAIRAMNKLRAQIHNMSHQSDKGAFQVTMSFGVACFENNDDFNLVFNRADTALYRAKSRGRNQVSAELKKNV